jgi:hypothetical protein
MFTNEQNPGEAISAVKALQKANAQGQRIYHITQANQATILPNIHHHPDTMDEIRNALNAGKEVITHTDAVSVPGWSGAGYIITDPVTGDGAYKIAGGGNGGILAFSGGLLGVFGLFLLSQAIIAPIAAFLILSLAFHLFVIGVLELVLSGATFDKTAFIDWGGFTLAALAIPAALGTAGLGAALLGLAFALAAVINDFPK